MIKNYCLSCMRELGDETMLICPYCGEPLWTEVPAYHLRPGSLLLNGEFLVGRALGEGGFGITYIGRDLTLDLPVAIKEYYPKGYSSRDNACTNNITISESGGSNLYRTGQEAFLEEARMLARFAGQPGLVTVRRFFEENNTAYIVMELLRGTTLKQRVKEGGPIPGSELFPLLRAVMGALEKVHAAGVLHRDISPDNIMLLDDNEPKLLDFGAARQVGDSDKSLSVVLKYSYAPPEQYSRHGGQGPWTDVYALCATMYFCLTGVKPTESIRRMEGESLPRPLVLGAKISPQQENVLLRGLAVHKEDRFQNVKDLEEALFRKQPDPITDDPVRKGGQSGYAVVIEDLHPKRIKTVVWLAVATLALIAVGFALGRALGIKSTSGALQQIFKDGVSAVQVSAAPRQIDAQPAVVSTPAPTPDPTPTPVPTPSPTPTPEAHQHEWGAWTVISNPGCENTGKERRTCLSDPAHIEEKEIPALGHDWIAATFTQPQTCARCGRTTGSAAPETTIPTRAELESIYRAGNIKTTSDKGVQLLIPHDEYWLSTPYRTTVKASRVNGMIYIMPAPKSGNGNLGVIADGTEVLILAKQNGCLFFVAYDGRMGWNGEPYFR